jgi:hypothetical protein
MTDMLTFTKSLILKHRVKNLSLLLGTKNTMLVPEKPLRETKRQKRILMRSSEAFGWNVKKSDFLF